MLPFLPFSGSTVEELNDYVNSTAKKYLDIIIIHVGTNNVSSTQIVEKLIKLHDHIKTITPSTQVVLSNIIRRHDFTQEHLDKKII